MSIGSIVRGIDRLIDNAIIFVGDMASDYFEARWPMTPVRPAWMEDNPLADAEAERDCWEPDELYAALNRGREKAAAEELVSKLAHAQNQVNDIVGADFQDQFTTADLCDRIETAQEDARKSVRRETVRRPFSDTDDFAEPVGEHPDIDPAAVIGKRRCWDGIGGHPIHPAGAGESEAPAASRATNLAAVKQILDDRLDAAQVEPFDKWLTLTAAEILNAVTQLKGETA